MLSSASTDVQTSRFPPHREGMGQKKSQNECGLHLCSIKNHNLAEKDPTQTQNLEKVIDATICLPVHIFYRTV